VSVERQGRADLAEVGLVSISQALLHLIHLVLEVVLPLLHAPCKLRLQPCKHLSKKIPLTKKLCVKARSIAGLSNCCVDVVRLTDARTDGLTAKRQFFRHVDGSSDRQQRQAD